MMKCSRCSHELDSNDDRINVTIPCVGVVHLCGSCWCSLIQWCKKMVTAR